MTLNDVYEKYSHMDSLLSDKEWLPEVFMERLYGICGRQLRPNVEGKRP